MSWPFRKYNVHPVLSKPLSFGFSRSFYPCDMGVAFGKGLRLVFGAPAAFLFSFFFVILRLIFFTYPSFIKLTMASAHDSQE